MNGEWKPIKTAPHDGTTIFIDAKLNSDIIDIHKILIVRYDSWNCQFRTLEKGEVIDYPQYIILAWKEFEWPIRIAPNEVEKFMNLLK